jgi:PadR family transcriptional regulator, regulatory protein PadR
VTENNRRARYYSLTAEGKRELAAELAQWKRASAAVNWVLGVSGGAA